MNVDKKINQLKQAFLTKGKIVIINVEEWYSMELKKNCKNFIVRLDSEEAITRRRELRKRIDEEKKELKKHKKGSNKHKEIKNYLEFLNDELVGNFASKDEFYSKIKVLLFLVESFKKHRDKKGVGE
ncbi:MAG: hypothetical protein ACRCX2_11835 [Paraclostridium sp.]